VVQTDEHDLIERLRAGDEAAFTILIDTRADRSSTNRSRRRRATCCLTRFAGWRER